MTDPTPDELLDTAQIAALLGISPYTWRSYVHRGRAPAPARTVGRAGLWHRHVIEEWAANRPGQGTRTDLTPK